MIFHLAGIWVFQACLPRHLLKSGTAAFDLFHLSHIGRGFSQLFSSPAPHSYVLKTKFMERFKPKGGVNYDDRRDSKVVAAKVECVCW